MSAVRCGRCGIYCEPEPTVVAGPRCARCYEEERAALGRRSKARKAQRGARASLELDEWSRVQIGPLMAAVMTAGEWGALWAALAEKGGGES